MITSIRYNAMADQVRRNLSGHYNDLAKSVRRLSSGLRVGMAADDAAGLSIREFMRAEVSAINQGLRNVNDAISLIQTADGALQIIDEKLIRMKELAEQAATGTYSSDQRLMIDSEFQAMGAEINRIANETTFNGVHLLNGNLSGPHLGSGLTASGALKVHFGPGNDAAEDYYYIGIGDSTLYGLGLSSGGGGGPGAGANIGNVPVLGGILVNAGGSQSFNSGLISFGVIPKGTKNLQIFINDHTVNDDLQLFTASGKHIAGTTLATPIWSAYGVTPSTVDTLVTSSTNGFDNGASYDASMLNGFGGNVPFTPSTAGNTISYNGMSIGYSGDGNPIFWPGLPVAMHQEYLTINEVTEDLILMVPGGGVFDITASWSFMPAAAGGGGGIASAVSIRTQTQAQGALATIDEAIITKDNIRANLGAMQNRLENTASNLQIQAENLLAAESRISDADVATEMTEFVRSQMMASTATTVLAQANNVPQMLLTLLK